MAGKDLRTTVTILGRDALSPVVATAAARSTATLRALNTRVARLNTISSGAFGFAGSASKITAGIAIPLGLAAKEAINFESEMASVGKVANLALGSSKLNQLGEQAKDVSEYLGEAANESARAFAALKQSGLAIDQLKEVAKFTGEAGVAFDMLGKDAGTAFGNIRSALGETVSGTVLAFDAINQLSNTMNATPSRLISFMTAGGAGVANALRMPAQDIAAFGATFIAAGKSGEEAATIMERAAKNIYAKKGLTPTFLKNGKGTAGLLAVLQKGANIKDDTKQIAYFKQFGEYGLDVRRLAVNMNGPNGLTGALSQVATKQKYAGAVQKEFNAKMQATEYQLKRLRSSVMRVVIDLGTAALPIIKQLAADVLPVIKNIGAWVKRNPELTSSILKGAAALAIFTGSVAALSAVVGSVTKLASWVITLYKWGKWAFYAARGTSALTGSVPSLTGVLGTVAGPAALAAAGIGAIWYAVDRAYTRIESFHRLIAKTGAFIDAFVGNFRDVAQLAFAGDWVSIVKMMADGTMGKKWKAVKLQTQINTDAEMKDFQKNAPKDPKLTGAALENAINPKVQGSEFYKAVEHNRKLRKAQELARMQGRPAPKGSLIDLKKVKEPEKPAAPKPVDFGGGFSSISVHNNPIFNVSGDLTEKGKKELAEMQRKSNDDLLDLIGRRKKEDRQIKRLSFQ